MFARALLFRDSAASSSLLASLGRRSIGCCQHALDAHHGPCCPSQSNTSLEVSDQVFEVFTPPWKFGPGAIDEIGQDLRRRGLKRPIVFTDASVEKTETFQRGLAALKAEGIDATVYNQVSIEPTDRSFMAAARFVQSLAGTAADPDSFVSIGGGSVIDTCKAASLYGTHPPPNGDFYEYVNVPIGKGKAPTGRLRPHLACPTTSGTGSEVTSIAICAIESPELGKTKTGIVHPEMFPALAVIDPNATMSLPSQVVASSGFDVLSHAIESFTARPSTARRPAFPNGRRPVLQGKNPYADQGCIAALQLCGKYFLRAVLDPSDVEARTKMSFASTLAGTAMGNAGTQLPHGLSYGVSGSIASYHAPGYPGDHPLLPHGMAVIMHAPSVARYTNPDCGHLQLECLHFLGHPRADRIKVEEAGEELAALLIDYMKKSGVPNGLKAVGFTADDIPMLVRKAFPQKRVIDNAPRPMTEEDLAKMYEGSLEYW